MRLRGPRGERRIAAEEFFVGPLTTAIEPDEILTEIRVPKLGPAGWSYLKFTRRAQDWATVGVTAVFLARELGAVEHAVVHPLLETLEAAIGARRASPCARGLPNTRGAAIAGR